MAQRTADNFHGVLEQAQTNNVPMMQTQVMESIEIIVFALVIFFVFFKFKNMVKVDSHRETPQNDIPKQKTKQSKLQTTRA